jgi:DtxR family manganese transport transcriptional regulator
VRDAHAQETAEDYCEAILDLLEQHGQCRVVHLAARFGVSHVTVVRIIERLDAENLVITEPYRPVQLSPEGKRLARRSRDRHDVVYAALLALGVPPKAAAADAEGIEHHVSTETLKHLRRFVARSASGE